MKKEGDRPREEERNDRKDSWNQNNTKIQRHRHRAAPHPERGPDPSAGRVTPEKKKESCSEGSVVTKRYRRRRTEEQGARGSQSRAVRLLEPLNEKRLESREVGRGGGG